MNFLYLFLIFKLVSLTPDITDILETFHVMWNVRGYDPNRNLYANILIVPLK